MHSVFEFKDIQCKAKRVLTIKVLHAYISKENIFPLQLKLPKIKSNELGLNFAKFQAIFLKMQDNAQKYGFMIEYSNQDYRTLGTQKIPTYITFNKINSWLKTTEYTATYLEFCRICDYILDKLPVAYTFLLDNTKNIMNYTFDDWQRIIQVCQYLHRNTSSNVYLRQLDIVGVDTKFIETHKKIIHTLVSVMSSNTESVKSLAHGVFEQIYGIKNHNINIRFRLLDNSLNHKFCDSNSWLRQISDFSIPLHEFMLIDIPCNKIFITENKISGISFPEVADSIIIFGLGYGVEVLKHIKWLKDKEIIYWGDIDTHGFAILSQMRGYFSQTQSLMMDINTLEVFKDLCTHESKQTNAQLVNLTDNEQELYNKLLKNHYGENIRLEQERIKLEYVKNQLYSLS